MARKLFGQIRKQWMGALALFLVLSGGVAYAGATITGSDVVNGSLTTADYKNNDIRSADVLNAGTGGLTGQDIKDKSGVDTCTDGFSTERAGDLCFRVANLALEWDQALRFCGDLELHVPTAAEAISLAGNHAIPGVDSGERFWTDEFYVLDGTELTFAVDHDGGGPHPTSINSTAPETVCVTTPTN